jgi:hypothetical protein
VQLPDSFVPPTAVDGPTCPPAAFSQIDAAPDGAQVQGCTTLSGFSLGPSRTLRPDGSVERTRLVDALGEVSRTIWCPDGAGAEHWQRGQPEATVKHRCAH